MNDSAADNNATAAARVPARLALYTFFEKNGIVRDFVAYYLRALKEVAGTVVVISNGALSASGRERLSALGVEILERENSGLDFSAWKAALEKLGRERLSRFDEIILCNCSCYGPVYPFSKLFEKMASRECDFWGLFRHPEIKTKEIPEHLQSYFLVLRKKLVQSRAFEDYWRELVPAADWAGAVCQETHFTQYFESRGFCSAALVPAGKYNDYVSNPTIPASLELLRDDAFPLVKRKVFAGEKYSPLLATCGARSAPDVLQFLKNETDYDPCLIFQDLLATQPNSALRQMLHLTFVLPDEEEDVAKNDARVPAPVPAEKVALILYSWYDDLVPENCRAIETMPAEAEIFIVVTEKMKAVWEARVAGDKALRERRIEIRIQENRGRNEAAYWLTCGDVVKTRDIICVLHDKKSEHMRSGRIRAHTFARHCQECVVKSAAYVRHVLRVFRENPHIGLLMPPTPVDAYFYNTPILGREWGINRAVGEEIYKKLSLSVPFDAEPNPPYGAMFWLRGNAMRPFYRVPWTHADFPEEPLKSTDGTLLHALERMHPMIAQEAGYFSGWVLPQSAASALIDNLYFQLRERIVSAAERKANLLRFVDSAISDIKKACGAPPQKKSPLPKKPPVAAPIPKPPMDPHEENVKLIRNSRLFDAQWYLRQIPGAVPEDVVPAKHYLDTGWRSGLNPSPHFDGNAYLRTYPKVASAKTCPLLHYLKNGECEGRVYFPVPVPDFQKMFSQKGGAGKTVLLVSHELTYTGACLSLLCISKILKDAGWNVNVLSRKDGALKNSFLENGIPVFLEPLTQEILQATVDKGCRLVIANTAVLAQEVAFFSNFVPVVWWLREPPSRYTAGKFIRSILRKSIHSVVSSEYSRKQWAPFTPNPAIIEHGIADTFRGVPVETGNGAPLRFAVIGRVDERKGQDVFVEAVKKLPRSVRKRAEFLIVGSDAPSKTFADSTERSAAGMPEIKFFDEITDPAKMTAFYESLSAVVVPSREEPTSRVAIEAMMMGRGVVFSDHVGAQYLLDEGNNGRLFKSEDSDALAKILEELIRSPEILARWGKSAREKYLATNTLPVFEKKILDLVARVVPAETETEPARGNGGDGFPAPETLSVVVPVYNAKKELSDLLASMEATDFLRETDELIFIDDSSPDAEILPLLRAFTAKHANAKLLENPENLGFIKTANTGLRVATGDVIAILNSDTKVPDGFKESIIRCFASDEKIVFASPVATHSGWFDIPVDDTAQFLELAQKTREFFRDTPIAPFTSDGFCFCARKAALSKTGVLDEVFGKGYCEEDDLVLRATVLGYKTVLIRNLLVAHRRHASFSSARRAQIMERNREIFINRWGSLQRIVREQYGCWETASETEFEIKKLLFGHDNFPRRQMAASAKAAAPAGTVAETIAGTAPRPRALPRILVRLGAMFILNKSARKRWRERHMDLTPQDGVDVNLLPAYELARRRAEKHRRNPLLRIFNTFVPATRAKMERIESHLQRANEERSANLLKELRRSRDELRNQLSALREELSRERERTEKSVDAKIGERR